MNPSELHSHTISRELEVINTNFRMFMKDFPSLYQAAEMVNGMYVDLIYDKLFSGQPSSWKTSAMLMLHGAHQSWVVSYLMTAGCHNDIGLMAARRAIEFTCYISKVHRNDNRAGLWFEAQKYLWTQNEDALQLRKEFGCFSIPSAYFGENYRHLRHLLVFHDFSSEFGVHANYGTLIHKFHEDKNGTLTFTMQDIKNGIGNVRSLGIIILLGHKILNSVVTVLKEEIKDFDNVQSNLTNLRSMIRRAKLEVGEVEFRGNIPRPILEALDSDENPDFDKRFEDLRERYPRKT